MKLTQEKRDAMIKVGGGFLLGLAILWWFGVRAQQDELERVNARIMESTAAADKAANYVNMRDKAQANLQVTRTKLEAEETGLAPIDRSYRRNWLLKEINRVIARSGVPVDLDSITLQEPSDGNVELLPKFPFSASRFRVRMTAHYSDFGKFLADFENAFPYARVQDFIIKPAEAAAAGIEVAADSPAPGAAKAKEVQVSEKLSFDFVVVTLIKTLSTP